MTTKPVPTIPGTTIPDTPHNRALRGYTPVVLAAKALTNAYTDAIATDDVEKAADLMERAYNALRVAIAVAEEVQS